MANLNLKNFKKHSSDPHTTTLVHPDGHQIRIAHKGMKPELKKQVDALPHFDDGGMAAPMSIMGDPASDIGQPASHMSNPLDFINTNPSAPNMSVMPNSEPASNQDWKESTNAKDTSKEPNMPNITPKAPQRQVDISGAKAAGNQDIMGQGISSMESGIKAEATAKGNLAQDQGRLAENQAANDQRLLNDFQTKTSENQQMIADTIHDIQNGHIDPNHYINDMSTTAKVGTAIGMLLSGLGSGLSGQPNAAMDFLNKQIDRDVEAQRTNMNNKHNLMSALNAQFGNIREASTMTKAIYSEMYANQLQQAAAKVGTPMAIAQAQQAIGQLKLKYGPEMQQMALQQTVRQGVQQGAVDRAQAIPFMVPKEQQTAALKEHGNSQAAKLNEEKLMQAFDNSAKENTVMRTGAGLRTPGEVMDMENLFLPMIHDAEGKVSEFEHTTLKQLIPKPGDTDSKIAIKREALQHFIDAKKATPTLDAFGLHDASTAAKPINKTPNKR